MNENDNNKNRKYPVMDKRVLDTYAKASTSTNKNALSDPYVKAFRYASDKIIENGEGIVCMVTNNGFLDGIAFDGMRKHLMQDFSTVRIIDLKGNIRKDSMRDGIPLGEEHTVFGLGAMVGISIALCEKKQESHEHAIEYWDTHFRSKRVEKFAELELAQTWFGLPSRTLQPNAKNVWLTEGMADDWDSLMPIGSKEGKSGIDGVIFSTYSSGVKSNGDAYTFNFSRQRIERISQGMIQNYTKQRALWIGLGKPQDVESVISVDETILKWVRRTKRSLARDLSPADPINLYRKSMYRPYMKQWHYFERIFNEERYQFPRFFPLPDSENIVICVSGIGSSKPFQVLSTNSIPCLDILEKTQCFPFYVYDEDGTNRRDNITDWGLEQFRNHYSDSTISKMDIFHYVYGLLHDPHYREKYAANLKRELPRIPFAKHFRVYAEAGKKLMDMHLHYEEQERYPVKEEWSLPKGYIHPHGIPVNSIEQVPLHERYAVKKMKRDRNDPTKLIYNDFLTLTGIPTSVDHYMLGNRSALNWIIDQYQVSIDKRSGIVNDPNEYCKEINNPRYIVELIQSIITLSMNTNEIVNGLPKDGFGE